MKTLSILFLSLFVGSFFVSAQDSSQDSKQLIDQLLSNYHEVDGFHGTALVIKTMKFGTKKALVFQT